jgi:hypothetical protein
MHRVSRADYIQRLQESVRRYTKVRTYFGLIAVPIGTPSMAVLPLNRSKSRYILLSAQSKALQNKIDYEEVQLVAEAVHQDYNVEKCSRSVWHAFISFFSYIMIILTFLFLLAIFLTLMQTTGLINAYIAAGYVVTFAVCYFLFCYG